ncbi:carbohydrate ABC transporter permease [Algisphaera agarilytica]|uniref:Multiple sugar transport system permease protein n=1 Tax=Algisphaera agarilytica TaxID=1385975 RepID=A0A7X0H666_9BACT|nr:sugar ABC transporter permease [Algisphaera agarilytica]MBB6428514.1 multiple sugar transport system permease protein [Algisphaera agarilytica]
MTRNERRKLGMGLLFISPWLIGFALFGIYPICMAVYYSFCDYDVLRSAVWVGPMNYTDMMSDDVFWKAIYNTLFYALFSVPLGLMLALVIAVLLNRPIAGRSFFRTFFYIPSIVPLVAVAMVWMWLFNGDLGLMNYGLSLIGIEGPQWLADASWTKPTLILSSVWQVGGAMVLFLAGLQDVPKSLYESADLDGANPLGQFWHISVPMVSPVIYFNLIIGIIGSIQEFVKPFVMLPGGGENRSALLFAVYIYENAFLYGNMGYACAMAIVLFFIIMFLTWLATRAMGRHVYYAGE